ncbi:putative NadA (Quinolate synthase) [Phytophthora infestans]|nr:putative NadA (Quinolate synthase) [Phytophthora infestans]
MQTVLQAFTQVPHIIVLVRTDTYMDENLQQVFDHIAQPPDDKIYLIHPQHNRTTVVKLLPCFGYAKEGNCVMHRMFGDKMTQCL